MTESLISSNTENVKTCDGCVLFKCSKWEYNKSTGIEIYEYKPTSFWTWKSKRWSDGRWKHTNYRFVLCCVGRVCFPVWSGIKKHYINLLFSVVIPLCSECKTYVDYFLYVNHCTVATRMSWKDWLRTFCLNCAWSYLAMESLSTWQWKQYPASWR